MPASPTSRGRRASASVPPARTGLAEDTPRGEANGLRSRLNQWGRTGRWKRMGQPRQAGRAGANFGFLEHRRETRFPVPKITFIVTPSSLRTPKKPGEFARLVFQKYSNSRLMGKVPKIRRVGGRNALQPPTDADRRRSLPPWQILAIFSKMPGFGRRCQVVLPPVADSHSTGDRRGRRDRLRRGLCDLLFNTPLITLAQRREDTEHMDTPRRRPCQAAESATPGLRAAQKSDQQQLSAAILSGQLPLLFEKMDDCGRDGHCCPPPAQIRT